MRESSISRKLGSFHGGSTRLVRPMNIGRCVNQSVAALLVASCGALCLAGCSTTMDVHSASDSELKSRQNEINHKIATDDFGLSWGLSRWVSHATEKNKTLKEKEQIDAELLRRRRSENVGITARPHSAPNVAASSTDNLAEPQARALRRPRRQLRNFPQPSECRTNPASSSVPPTRPNMST